MWRVRRTGNRTIACTLERRGDSGWNLALTLDGGEIAAQQDYLTTMDAVRHAGILLERLTADGWTLVADMPPIVVH
jgi:hypothetical protein